MTCLTEPVLPLRFDRTAADITARLESWAQMAGDAFDLSGTIARARELEHACAQFPTADLTDDERNAILLRLSRILVPLGFSRRKLYGTEPALSIDPMPVLSPNRRLTAKDTTEKERMAIRLELVRAVNYINHSLRQALQLLQR